MGIGFRFHWGKDPLAVERNKSGDWFYTMFTSRNNRQRLTTYEQKLNAVLTNPAALKVAKLNADLGSLGQINKYENEKLVEKNFLYGVKKKPNFYQSWTQFIWDYYFWLFIGQAVLWRNSNMLTDQTQLYWLNLANIDFSDGKSRFGKPIFSKANYNNQQKQTLKYTFPDGTTKNIPLTELTFYYDLSNGITGNWYEGASVIDALYKIIENSELALDAKGINLEFSQKFMVSGKHDPNNVTSVPMSGDEKISIEDTVRSNKKVHAVKTAADVKRFVDDIARLKLDESFYNDYFMIGTMRGIPRDVLEANLRGSTYENQEKATSRHVEYSLKPAGQNFTDSLESVFGYSDLRMSWEHLMFNQVFEKERQEVTKLKLENLQLAKELNVNIEDI